MREESDPSAARSRADGLPRGVGVHLALVEPRIPSNTGNVIRTAAATGAHLHLVEPLGFDLSDAKLRRAGLDYHDLATVSVHPTLDALWDRVRPARTFAFTRSASVSYTASPFAAGDLLMFGAEPTGLDAVVLADPRVTERLRIPMLPGRRSLNLANSVAIATYEAWRQIGFPDPA